MKDLKLNYAVGQFIDGSERNWEGKLIEDWIALHSAHEADVELIEILNTALMSAIGILGKPGDWSGSVKDALSGYDAWRKGEE